MEQEVESLLAQALDESGSVRPEHPPHWALCLPDAVFHRMGKDKGKESEMRMLDRLLRKVGNLHSMGTVEGYCLRCKAHRKIKNSTRVDMKTGKPRIQGYCAVCNVKMSTLVKAR